MTQLLIRAEAEPGVRRLLDAYRLRREPVTELDGKVIRLRNRRGDPIELAHLAANLRRQGVPISVNYLTPMGGT